MPKAWAVISIGAVNPSIDDGVNIDSAQYITMNGNADYGLKITLPAGGEMRDTNYAVMASVYTSSGSGATSCFSVNVCSETGGSYNPTTATFTLMAREMTGTVHPWTFLADLKVVVFVFGKQS